MPFWKVFLSLNVPTLSPDRTRYKFFLQTFPNFLTTNQKNKNFTTNQHERYEPELRYLYFNPPKSLKYQKFLGLKIRYRIISSWWFAWFVVKIWDSVSGKFLHSLFMAKFFPSLCQKKSLDTSQNYPHNTLSWKKVASKVQSVFVDGLGKTGFLADFSAEPKARLNQGFAMLANGSTRSVFVVLVCMVRGENSSPGSVSLSNGLWAVFKASLNRLAEPKAWNHRFVLVRGENLELFVLVRVVRGENLEHCSWQKKSAVKGKKRGRLCKI